MEIGGTILSKHVDHVRITTDEKAQQLDIFYTESLKLEIEALSEKQKIVFSVKIQSIDYYSLKLGKHWLREVIIPARPKPEHGRKQKIHFGHLENKNDFGEYIE